MSRARGNEVLVWSIVAAVAGLTAFLAPAYLAPGTFGHKDYGASALPWFAAVTNNLSFVGSIFRCSWSAPSSVSPNRPAGAC